MQCQELCAILALYCGELTLVTMLEHNGIGIVATAICDLPLILVVIVWQACFVQAVVQSCILQRTIDSSAKLPLPIIEKCSIISRMSAAEARSDDSKGTRSGQCIGWDFALSSMRRTEELTHLLYLSSRTTLRRTVVGLVLQSLS